MVGQNLKHYYDTFYVFKMKVISQKLLYCIVDADVIFLLCELSDVIENEFVLILIGSKKIFCLVMFVIIFVVFFTLYSSCSQTWVASMQQQLSGL